MLLNYDNNQIIIVIYHTVFPVQDNMVFFLKNGSYSPEHLCLVLMVT